jgi:hypothetical protein
MHANYRIYAGGAAQAKHHVERASPVYAEAGALHCDLRREVARMFSVVGWNSSAVDGKQIENAAVCTSKRRHLARDGSRNERGIDRQRWERTWLSSHASGSRTS